jgi:hypothetical protein
VYRYSNTGTGSLAGSATVPYRYSLAGSATVPYRYQYTGTGSLAGSATVPYRYRYTGTGSLAGSATVPYRYRYTGGKCYRTVPVRWREVLPRYSNTGTVENLVQAGNATVPAAQAYCPATARLRRTAGSWRDAACATTGTGAGGRRHGDGSGGVAIGVGGYSALA